MNEKFQLRQPRGQAGEDQARHGAAGFVRPAQNHPDLVFRLRFGRKVGDIGSARRMQQNRLAGFGGDFEDREEARLIETGAVDVGMQLQPIGVSVQ
jgi:hypothetical protein